MERRLTTQGPFPVEALLSYLVRRGTPGLEVVSGSTWTRQTPEGEVVVRFEPQGVAVEGPASADDAVVRMLRLERSWEAPPGWTLDPVLGPRLVRCPGLRPLGAWNPFELCLRTVVGQQVTVAAARTLMARIGERSGGFEPARVAEADLAVGMPARRVATVRALARAAAEGSLPWSAPWPRLHDALTALPGFGPWTLAYLALRLGGDLDAFPETDLGLIRAVGASWPRDLLARAEAWRPHRGWAAAILWMAPLD